ncbi:polyprenol monophosphomannose synthase [Demequina sp. NBRC 110052]|uniref:polyprenol monophosphomannose synthase n=1 Tax=Demequina sp. NBRC 110052 TaxID=1570341 RepID=UPI0009FD556E|nr:polyprenol monophosphomannose synthase [Demequina sp. NBRC 110052]
MSTLVIIPTYNERESLPVQLAGVREHAPDVDVLVVDDGSPDGTGEWADEAAAGDSHVHVLHRTAKAGLGAAYQAGFAWGLERGYDVLVEMDADGSHQAHELPSLLARVGEGDLVIGSRWVPGGSVRNWPTHRRLLSTGANTYVRLALGIGVKDSTAGFRAYTADILRAIDLHDVESQGYCFQIDMCWHVLRAGGTVVEVPIEFVERVQGASKMSGAIIREALLKTTLWGAGHRLHQLAALLPARRAD